MFHMHPNFSKHIVLKLANKTVLKSFEFILSSVILAYKKKIDENFSSQLKK